MAHSGQVVTKDFIDRVKSEINLRRKEQQVAIENRKKFDVVAYWLFDYNQFPLYPDCMLKVTWEQQPGQPGMISGGQGWIVSVHPDDFVKMVQETYGAIAALNMLKIITHSHIDNLGYKYFQPVFNRINFLDQLWHRQNITDIYKPNGKLMMVEVDH